VRESRTTAALVLIAAGLWVLVLLARPFTLWKALLVGAMVGAVTLILVIPGLRDFYALALPDTRVLGEAALIAAAAVFLLEVGWRASRVIQGRRAAAT
jgi:cation-transporting ATPase E